MYENMQKIYNKYARTHQNMQKICKNLKYSKQIYKL